MLFRAASWSIAFILLAKGVGRLFFWNELLANIYILIFNVIGYKLGSLEGLGISFLLAYGVYFIQVFVLAKIKYDFDFNKAFIYIFIISLLLATSCFILVKLLQTPYSYLAGGLLVIVSAWYSYKELDKRIGLKAVIEGLKKRIVKR